MNRGAARTSLPLGPMLIWLAATGSLLAGCSGGNNGTPPAATPTSTSGVLSTPTATSTRATTTSATPALPTATPTTPPTAIITATATATLTTPPTSTPATTATATTTTSPTATPTATSTPTASETPELPVITSSSALAVDPVLQLAFVPLLDSPDPITGNSRLAVINTAVDPDVADAIAGTLVLTHPDDITSVALDTVHHLVIVTSGGIGNGGLVDLIDEATHTLVDGSPFAMPPGADVEQLFTNAGYGQAVFDPVRKLAIISTLDDLIQNNCAAAGDCTGFTTFDLTTFTFTPIISTTASYDFSFNPLTNVAIPASLQAAAERGVAVDVENSIGCRLNDENLAEAPLGVGFDPSTNIAVIGNDDGTATVLNLFGSSFDAEDEPPCFLVTGGTPPNSVQVPGLASDSAAVAVNPVTHQAFLIEDDILGTEFNDGISLISLPQTPVTQISSEQIPPPVISTLPYDPFGFFWQTQSEPFQVTLDLVHNRAYAVSLFGYFMAQIDLTALQSNPSGISIPPPLTSSCVGLPGSLGCNNQNGLIFYPLPPAFE